MPGSSPDIVAEALDHHRAGRRAEAEGLYRRILAADPRQADALHGLGLLCRRAGKRDEALALLGRAVAERPGEAQFQLNFGAVLAENGRLAEAIAAYQRALALRPDYLAAITNLADALRQTGQRARAIAAYRQAVALQPDLVAAYGTLGNLLCEAGEVDEGVMASRRAVELRPEVGESYANMASGLFLQGKVREAVAALERAWELKPDHAVIGSNAVFAAHFHPDYDSWAIAAKARLWDQRHAARLNASIARHEKDCDRERRLRIGYASGDFRDHCLAMFMPALLRHHDREEFEVFYYSTVARPDGITGRFQEQAGTWRAVAGLNDQALADLVRADKIDILVDLSMHAAGGRPLLLARKPAPVQAVWFAYPGTTGISTVDYRLSDPYLDPPGAEEGYSETSIRLPDTFWCYDPRTLLGEDDPPIVPLPAEKNGYVTFGCLNNSCKINEETLALWGRVLAMTPRSRLRLLAAPGEARHWVARTLEQQGIEAGRVDFVPRQSRSAYRAEFQWIDLCLDTLPYNGHTTSLDSQWHGAPVITRVGRTVVGRAGWSQLSNLGLPDLAAFDDEAFIKIAVELAGDVGRLSELRRTLRQRMMASPLCDGGRFARGMEAAYREMWRAWCGRSQ